MKASWFLAAAMLLTATGAAAQQAPAQPTPAPPDAEKKICKTEPITGTRTRVATTCLTRAQWAALSIRTRQDIDDAARSTDTFTGDSNRAYTPSGDPNFSAAAR